MNRNQRRPRVARPPQAAAKLRGRALAGAKSAGRATGLEASEESLHRVRVELKRAVNRILKENGVRLKLHSMQLTDQKVGAAFRCCIINGRFVCGPQCG